MHRARLLIATAVIEAGAGLMLLCFPAEAFALLLGIDRPTPESTFIARVAGAVLLFLGVACWQKRKDDRSREATAVIAAMLLYNILVAALLAYAGAKLEMAGVALWPAVGLHTALAVWCTACLFARDKTPIS
jgi:Kef-type K+ transport system membrane component KefB